MIELSKSQIRSINNIVIAVENFAKQNDSETNTIEIGNRILDSLIEKLDEEQLQLDSGYRHIQFSDFTVYSNDEIELKKGEKTNVKIEKEVIYFNDELINVKNNLKYFFAVDIDEDELLELITVEMNETISPISVTYHIYKNINNELKEISTFNTIGLINDFYIKDKDIKLIYEPAEAAPGLKTEAHYTITY